MDGPDASGIGAMRKIGNFLHRTVENAGELVDDAFDAAAAAAGYDADDGPAMAMVDAPTPEDRWFTPHHGWPTQPAGTRGAKGGAQELPEWRVPRELVELQRDPFPKGVIGELRLELLQADITQLDHKLFGISYGRADTYAVIVCERVAAQSAIFYSSQHPAWSVDTARAFRLPITCPFSTVCIALRDNDPAIDDNIGRVVVELARVAPNTVYDAWYPLQHSTLKRHVCKRGSVRLRISLTFQPNDRAALTSYLHTLPGPNFVIRFNSYSSKRDSMYALKGKHQTKRYRWSILSSHVAELQQVIVDVGDVLKDLLFWKSPFLSITYFVLWQVIVSYPFLILACVPLSLLASLENSFHKQPAYPSVCGQPRRLDHVKTLLVGVTIPPLEAEPGEWDDNSDGGDSESDDEDETGGGNNEAARKRAEDSDGRVMGILNALVSGALLTAWSGLKAAIRGSRPSLAQERLRLQEEVDEKMERLLNAALESVKDESKSQKTRQAPAFTLNPVRRVLSRLLGPAQNVLGEICVWTRILARVRQWHDRVLVMWLHLALLLAAAVSIAIGYLLWRIPWSLVFEWAFRLAGAALFGPHMHWIGKRVERATKERVEKEEEFDSASDARREEMLADEKDKLEAAARERIREELKAALEKEDDCDSHPIVPEHGILNRPRPNAGSHKYPFSLDVKRSRLRPFVAVTDTTTTRTVQRAPSYEA